MVIMMTKMILVTLLTVTLTQMPRCGTSLTKDPPADDNNDNDVDDKDDICDIADHDFTTNAQVWDISNKKTPLLHTLDDHLGYVTCIQWIPGELLK